MRERWTAKIWYIWVDGKEVGPMTVAELRSHPAVTPDILVRKEGEKEWKPLREVKELWDLFDDSKELEEGKKSGIETAEGDELTMDMLQEPSPFRFWMLVILLIIIYTFIYLLWR